MTVIEVSFLTGRYCAASHHDREESEWPPHGARLFSAMVAAWADSEPPDESERAALEWLEVQSPPRIMAPEAVPRRVVSHFVPVNDASVISPKQYQRRVSSAEDLIAQWENLMDESEGEVTKPSEKLQDKISKALAVSALTDRAGSTNVASALSLLPESRNKKERHFPSVTLVEPVFSASCGDRARESRSDQRTAVVTYGWDESAPFEVLGSLNRLLERVTRLGHSSSLVSCRLREEEPEATHIPGEGPLLLRWVGPGQLAALQAQHQRHQAIAPRRLPFRGVRYRVSDPNDAEVPDPASPSTAGSWIVFEVEPRHRRLPMTRTVELTRALRSSILRYVPDPLPEGVSGHLSDGTPTGSPHIAFLALPNAGHIHADGRVMGLSVSLPDGLGEVARNATLRGIGLWERERGDRPLELRMGRGGVLEMHRRQPPLSLVSLRQSEWSRPSRWWASVTPVALPTHPGDLASRSPAARAKAWVRAEEAVAKSCEHVGLPRPQDVRVSLVPHVVGARPAREFPAFTQGRGSTGGTVRRLVHASVEFSEPVRGPLMLGSGRFVGLGLMRPVDEAVTHRSTPRGDSNRG